MEDGLYALEDKLKDPAFVAKLGKFVAAANRDAIFQISALDFDGGLL